MTTTQQHGTTPGTADRTAVHRDPEVRKQAARLKLVTDAGLGLTSPQWVWDLADLDSDGMRIPRMRRRPWWDRRRRVGWRRY